MACNSRIMLVYCYQIIESETPFHRPTPRLAATRGTPTEARRSLPQRAPLWSTVASLLTGSENDQVIDPSLALPYLGHNLPTWKERTMQRISLLALALLTAASFS